MGARESSIGNCLRIALAIVCATLVAGCNRFQEDYIPYVGDKYPHWVAPGWYSGQRGSPSVYWLDSERILYLAGEDVPNYWPTITLRIWHVDSGAVRSLGPAVGELCYRAGHVQYVEAEEGTVGTFRVGPLEAAETVRAERKAFYTRDGNRNLVWSDLHCRWIDPATLAPDAHCKVPLLPGDGHLQTGGWHCVREARDRVAAVNAIRDSDARSTERVPLQQELDAVPVRLVTAAGAEHVLPIQTLEFQKPVYVEWNRRYAIPAKVAKNDFRRVVGDWHDPDYPIYLIGPDGSVETIRVPMAPWFDMKPNFKAVTRAGVVMQRLGPKRMSRKLIDGLVLFDGKRWVQVSPNSAHDAAVSPDGCRLAYGDWFLSHPKNSKVPARLHVIDLCKAR